MARPTLADGQVLRILTERSTCPPSFPSLSFQSQFVAFPIDACSSLMTEAVSFLPSG